MTRILRTRRRAVAAVALLATASLLVACSDDGDDPATKATSTRPADGATTSTSAEPPAPSTSVWSCHPGQADDPCAEDLTATVRSPGGAERTEPAAPATDPPIDCFYVYPTVSEQTTPNATLDIDPQIEGVVRHQAARFATECRVFAPVYPQLTLSAIGGDIEVQQQAAQVAYEGLAEAWADYLAHDNDGRGFVLIGHSQGAGVLTRLIQDEIDTDPELRERLVSALLIGGNVLVPSGEDVGGSFDHVPACRAADQLHCVVAYSAFTETPPADATFGRAGGRYSEAFGTKEIEDPSVLCTNPAALDGGTGTLQSAFPTEAQPGTVGGAGAAQSAGLPLTADTPWVALDGWYTGTCESADGASFLKLTPVGDAPVPVPLPAASWGAHITEFNLTIGNLVELVGAQAEAYAG